MNVESINVVIIDDELSCQEALKNLVSEFCPEISLLGTAGSVAEGIDLVRTTRPDVVFLDIEMQDGTGFDFLQRVKVLDFEVIFTTAHENYALQAIKFCAIDYLLKPVDIDDLLDAVKKVRVKADEKEENKRLRMLLSNLSKSSEHQVITLNLGEGLEFIKVQDIIYCEANGAYTKFYLKGDRVVLVSKNLKSFEQLLERHNFYRCHNSYLVNLKEITRLVRTGGGNLIMSNGADISISPRKKESLLELFDR